MWELDEWRPNGDQNSVILGDSAYPLRRWLMTPVIRNVHLNNRNLENRIQAFLRSHRRTRFIVENAIGILKA